MKQVHQFYEVATVEALANPFNSMITAAACQGCWIFQKEICGFDDVEYFVKKYSDHLSFSTASELEQLQEEFVEYQLMVKIDIAERIMESARVKATETDEVY